MAKHPIAELEERAAKLDRGIEAILTERRQTHGSFDQNAGLSQGLKALMRSSPGWPTMSDVQREALDCIALKLSRILSGQADYRDHWDDIAGYARLASKDLTGET
jgi:Domain of unknown function (DUF6378)